MKKKNLFHFLPYACCILLLLFFCRYANALPVVNATATSGNCKNAGSINITATATSGLVLYALIAPSPVERPQQTTNTFTGLPSGSYTVAVYDGTTGATPVTKVVTINNNYTDPSFANIYSSVNAQQGFCGPQGYFTVYVANGKAPYTLQLMDVLGTTAIGTPVTTSSTSTTIQNLAIGSYTIRVMDACGTSVLSGTQTITADNDLRSITISNLSVYTLSYDPYVKIKPGSCDSLSTYAYSSYSFAVKNAAGNYVSVNSNLFKYRIEIPAGSNNWTNWVYLYETSDYVKYDYDGNPLPLKFEVQNPCTSQKTTTSATIPKLDYDLGTTDLAGGDMCNATKALVIGPKQYPYFQYLHLICYPLTVKVTEKANPANTNTYTWTSGTPYQVNNVNPNTIYTVTITDQKGIVRTYDYSYTAKSAERLSADVERDTCDLSVMTISYYSYVRNIDGSTSRTSTLKKGPYPITFTILNGPAGTIGNSVTVNNASELNASSRIWLAYTPPFGSLPISSYSVEVAFGPNPACRKDTVKVAPAQYISLKFQDEITTSVSELGCGKYNIRGDAKYTTTTGFLVSDYYTYYIYKNEVFYTNGSAYGSLPWSNLSPGNYTIKIYPLYGSPSKCIKALDSTSFVLPEYQLPVVDVAASGGMVCPGKTTGTLHIEAKGSITGTVLEYRVKAKGASDNTYTAYQSSPDFTNLAPGIYTVMVKDACGGWITTDLTLSAVSLTSLITVIGADNNIACKGSPVSLNIMQVGTLSALKWTLPDGAIISDITKRTINIPSFATTDAGTYTAEVTSAQGCTVTASVTLTESVATASISGNTTVCAGGTIPLTGSPANGIWSSNASSVATVNASGVVTTITSGNATITYKATNSNGCTATATKTISVKAFSVPVISDEASSVCTGSTTPSFTGSPASGTWSSDNTSVATINTSGVVTGITTGTANITYSIINGSGCTGVSNPVKVTVHPAPSATINGNNVICLLPATSPSLNYTGSTSGGSIITAYEWKINNTVVAATKDLSANFRTSGAHTLTYKVTTNKGCSSSATKSIIVDSVKAAFNIPVKEMCYQDNAITTENTTTGAYPVSYAWKFGDGSTSVSAAPAVHNYTSTGEYDVTLRATTVNGCVDNADTIKVSIHSMPSPTISGDNVVCLLPATSPSLSYTGSISGGSISDAYEWKINNAVVAATKDLSVDFRTSGAHTLTYKVTTNKGCSSSATKNIIVDSVKAAFNVLNPEICVTGNVVNLQNVTTSAYPATYSWLFGDNTTSTNDASSHTYNAAGSYDIELQATTSNGCINNAKLSKAIKLYTPPVMNITGDNAVCENIRTQFNTTVTSEDEITTYKWFANNLLIPDSVANNINLLFTNSGTYQVKAIVQTKHGCEESVTKTITINPTPKSATIHDTIICKGSTIQLYASDGTSYRWYSKQPAFDNGTNNHGLANVTPIQNTRYYVDIFNQFGCFQLDSVTVVKNDPVALSVSNDTEVCRGKSVKLWAKSNVSTYSWMPSERLNWSDVDKPVATPDTTTVYAVIAHSENVCPDESKQVKVTVNDIPTVSLLSDITLDAGQPVTLRPTVSDNVAYYNWLPAKGLTCYNCVNPILKADKNTTYTLKVKTNKNCEASDTIKVNVLCDVCPVLIPNAFTPNGDEINDIFYISGWGVQKVKNFRIYNRWGELVFAKENIPVNDKVYGWNGWVKGKPVTTTAAFVYIADIICDGGKQVMYKGTVVLIL